MNNSGLTSRLRQQSRRTGLAVGLAMAVVIALCIGAFVVAYAQLDPLTRDFIAQSTPTQTPAAAGSGDTAENNSNDNDSSDNNNSSNDNSSNPEPTNTPAPTPTPNGFVHDYVSNTEQGVNFRSGPGIDNEAITQLEAGTPLQSTGEEGQDGDGTTWMEFETEDGTTGWIRQIDAVPND
ncbi:hypothetical protein BH09CHL1_BH09CHL1_00350 [soil metagenome]